MFKCKAAIVFPNSDNFRVGIIHKEPVIGQVLPFTDYFTEEIFHGRVVDVTFNEFGRKFAVLEKEIIASA